MITGFPFFFAGLVWQSENETTCEQINVLSEVWLGNMGQDGNHHEQLT